LVNLVDYESVKFTEPFGYSQRMNYRFTFSLFCWLIWFGLIPLASAQPGFRVSGRVTDAITGAEIPFAALSVKGKPTGATADADGRYKLTLSAITSTDSLIVVSIGYQAKTVSLPKTPAQTLDVQLQPTENRLREVKVYGKGGDPAYRVLREAAKRRDAFDYANLTAFQYENYSRIEAYVNDFNQRSRAKKRRPGPLGQLLGRLPSIMDDNGQPAVPVFISETTSEFYHRTKPDRNKERVLKTRVQAVGINDGSLVSQFTGATFQQYNFYRNYVSVLGKDIPSPVGNAWQTLYLFRMLDTMAVGDVMCYQIDFQPKRATDLAFSGTVWLDTLRLGIVEIEAKVGKQANINFVDELRISQQYEVVDSTARLPTRTQITIDTDQPTPNAPGALIRFFVAAQKVVVNQPHEPDFYDPQIEMADDAKEPDDAFWERARPDPLSPTESRVFRLVDSVRNVPLIKIGGKILQLLANGYQPIGRTNLDLGPILSSYANNSIEGNRFQLGLQTNTGFSRRWVLSGYAAYGTVDERFKYGFTTKFIASRKHWTVMGLQYNYDLYRLGISPETANSSSIFYASTRFGTIRRGYLQEQLFGYVKRDLGSGITQTLGFRARSFDPLFAFSYTMPNGDPTDTTPRSRFNVSELVLETRFAPDELFIQNDNERLTLGASRKPIITLRYNLALRNVLGSSFTYSRLSAEIRHSVRVGVWGRTTYVLGGGFVPNTVPYPLLFIPLGNESNIRLDNAYNLMNFYEFATDRYATLRLEHNFEGLFFNRIPAIRRLKWRTVVTAKILAGSVSDANQALSTTTDATGQVVPSFQRLTWQKPYAEVSYGIDNIFKLVRVDAVHRLTYRDAPNATPFGIKISAWVNL
jgi:hypothetical protein